MSEVFVFRAGPFQLPSGPLNLYFSSGSELEPIPSSSDEAALRQIAEHERGRLLRCEPALEEAGRPLGFAVAPFSRKMAYRCAIACLELAVAPALEEVADLDVTDALCDGAHAFDCAGVTRVLPARGAYIVETSGAVARRYESMLQGVDSGAYGFLLYEEPGALLKVRDMADASPATLPDTLGLFLLREPTFVVEALHRVYGLSYLPRPTRTKSGARASLTEDEVLTLAAAARAFADMAARRVDTGSAVLEIDDKIIEARVKPFAQDLQVR